MAEGSEGTRRGHTTVARLLCESAVIHRWPLRRSRGQSSRCLVGQDQDMLYASSRIWVPGEQMANPLRAAAV